MSCEISATFASGILFFLVLVFVSIRMFIACVTFAGMYFGVFRRLGG